MSEPALFERGDINRHVEAETGMMPPVLWERLSQHLKRVPLLGGCRHKFTPDGVHSHEAPWHLDLEPRDLPVHDVEA
jgi:hypothetical protein